MAAGISSDVINTYIAGAGYNTVTGRNEALLWTNVDAPTCNADCDASGQLNIDDFICFQTLLRSGAEVPVRPGSSSG